MEEREKRGKESRRWGDILGLSLRHGTLSLQPNLRNIKIESTLWLEMWKTTLQRIWLWQGIGKEWDIRSIFTVHIAYLGTWRPIFFFFVFFKSTSIAYGSSHAKGLIRAAAAGLYHSHRNTRSEFTSVTYTTAHGNARSFTHWAGPGIKPASSWILVHYHWAMMGPPWSPIFNSCSFWGWVTAAKLDLRAVLRWLRVMICSLTLLHPPWYPPLSHLWPFSPTSFIQRCFLCTKTKLTHPKIERHRHSQNQALSEWMLDN